MKIVFTSSELAPHAKTGGLGDVAQALPIALAELGCDVRVVVPRYQRIPVEPGTVIGATPLTHHAGDRRYDGRLLELAPERGVKTVLVDVPALYDRPGIYGDSHDYGDNDVRFSLLPMAALKVARDHNAEVLHVNDWQTALGAAYVSLDSEPRPATVLTIHNLAFRGAFGRGSLGNAWLPESVFDWRLGELHGALSYLKLGLVTAGAITTVSPRYAKEIQTEAQGFELDGLLRHRRDRLFGILNGVDTTVWNPATDAALPARFHADDLSGKATCKRELQKELGLEQNAEAPLFVSVGRLTTQKGVDLVAALGPRLLGSGAQLAILGSGDPGIAAAFTRLRTRGRMAFVNRYDDALAHRMEAAGDFFLMPSRFEPCGLNQMYSMIYGTPPIVANVGGLHDTVTDVDEQRFAGTGFKLREISLWGLEQACIRAIRCFRDRPRYEAMQRRGMKQDFSWRRSARAYLALYGALQE